MTIQEKLESLQPYVVGIRFISGYQVVEAQFEKNWSLIRDDNFKIIPDEQDNTHLYFVPNAEGITIDDTLEHVGRIINHNIEQQKKHELLKAKVAELKEVFQNNSLQDLQKLEFKVGGGEDFEDLVGDQNEIAGENELSPDQLASETTNEEPKSGTEKQDQTSNKNGKKKPKKKQGSNKKQNNGQTQQNPQKEKVNEENEHKTDKVPGGKVELPAGDEDLHEAATKHAQGEQSIEVEEHAPNNGLCDHGPDETCPNCVDQKDL